MAFHFPLQAVYHFRQSVEHQQELRLRTANQQVAKVHHLVEQTEDGIKELQVRRTRELGDGMTAAEMIFLLNALSVLAARRKDLERELVRLKNLRDQQQRVFQQARRERETFESLRDEQFRLYVRNQGRREQRQLDDSFLLRQSYLRRG
ncbi:MAG: flagellar export protein FliJ [Candidatus Sulfotelmatobacter sp.]